MTFTVPAKDASSLTQAAHTTVTLIIDKAPVAQSNQTTFRLNELPLSFHGLPPPSALTSEDDIRANPHFARCYRPITPGNCVALKILSL